MGRAGSMTKPENMVCGICMHEEGAAERADRDRVTKS
jgi:hypothetical protein